MRFLALSSRVFFGCAVLVGMFAIVPPPEASADLAPPAKCLDGNRQMCAETVSGSTTLYFYWV